MADSLLATNNTEYFAEDEDEAEINEADVNIFIDEESEDDDEDQSFSNDDEYESVSEDEDEAEINEVDLNIFIDEESEDDDEGQSFRNDDEYESVIEDEDEDEADINEADANIFIDEESEDDDEYESVSEDDNEEEETEINEAEADVNTVIDEESEDDDEDLSFSDDDEYESSAREDDEYQSSVREDDEYQSSVSEDDDDDSSEEEQEDDWGSRPSASSQGSVAAVEEKQLCDQTSSQAGATGGGPCRSEFDSCTICMDAFHSVGDHQICCLPCGHLYGLSCITRWIKEHKQKCPQCNKKCRLSDVRKIYGQPVVVDQELVKKSQFLEAKCAYLEKKNNMREQLIANPNLTLFELTEAAFSPQGHGRVTGFGSEARPTHYRVDQRGSSSSSVNSWMSHQESDLLRPTHYRADQRGSSSFSVNSWMSHQRVWFAAREVQSPKREGGESMAYTSGASTYNGARTTGSAQQEEQNDI